MRRLPSRVASILILSLMLSWTATAAQRVEILQQTFEALGLGVDPDLTEKAVFEALVGLVDPHATLLGTNAPQRAKPGNTSPEIEEWPEEILYVKPGGFHGSNSTAVIERLGEWFSDTAAGVIVDIRDAGGEILEDAVALAGAFVDDGTDLYEIRDGQDNVLETARSTHDPRMPRMPPLMILIDGETRGASEALAASLKGQSGVMLIGSGSRGDAGLREVVTLANTQRLYMATRWIVPSAGDAYDRTGVHPHILISDDGPRDANPQKPFKENVAPDLLDRILNDPVLLRAADVVLGLKALRKP